ncbi:MAG: helix-turn-helix domain-containing protein [Lachnospiraceae bacterium]|nr:helix-turn-helix domain-containing protein [Lachnospiraceae bacterium]
MDETYQKQGYLYDDFRMFHLLDQERREIPFHYHDFYKVLVLLRGNVTYSIEGRSYRLSPYDIVLVSSGSIHRPEVGEGEPYERIIFYISREYLERYRSPDCDLAYCFSRAEEEKSDVLRFPALVSTGLMEVVSRLEENGSEGGYGAGLYARALFTEYMILMCRACRQQPDCFSRNITYNQKMIDLLRYINGHLGDSLSIDELAHRFYISKYHMMRQFKEETGYTIHSYITEKRILAARDLILAGESAKNACFACGFHDYSTFSRAFSLRMGKSPSNCKEKILDSL